MKVGDVFVRMALDNRDYRRGLDREEGFTRQKAMTLGKVFSRGFSVALGLGLVHGFRSIGGLLTDLITTAAKTETFDVAMQAVARASGYPIPVLQQQRKEIMALGIAEQEATQTLTRFMQAQLDTADAAKIARVAQDAGTIAGINSSEATDRMTEAIAKQRPELLSAFGMTRNLNDIYNDFAQTAGKTASSLSEVEKKQAMLNYIFKEGEKIAGAYESAMGTIGKQMGSLEKLELSKKLMQELKTALAQPLLIPAFSYWVDTMHNAFSQLQVWVEANRTRLLSWGMTAKNVLATIVSGVRWVTNAFIENWGIIRFAATAFLTYVTAAKAINLVSYAVRGLTLLLWALRGHAFSTSGYLGVLAASVRTYQAASLGAAGATNIFTYALHSASAAIKGFLASIPVVGWVLLALSVAVGGGVALWSKYSASVRAANDAAREAQLKKLADQQAEAAKAAMKAVKGENKLTDALGKAGKAAMKAVKGEDKLSDALGKAGKAATKTLMPFDEIHTIQKDMAGMGEIGDLDIPGFDMPAADMPGFDFDMPAADMPGFDFDMGDFFSGIEDAKPTLKGFWEWIKQGAGNLWEGVKEKWSGFWNWVKSWGLWQWLADRWDGLKEWAGNVWEGVKERWEGFKSWVASWAGPLWDGIKEKWAGFKEWAGDLWEGVKEKWNNFKIWAGNLWEGVKTKWGNFKDWVQEKWNAFWDPIKTKWNNFKTWAGNLWDTVKIKWDNFKTNIQQKWNAFWEPIKTRWNSFKSWAGELLAPVRQKWNSFVTWARGIWDRILTKWNEIKKWSLWTWIKNKADWLKNVFNFRWSLPKIKLPRFKVSWSKAGFWGKVGDFLGLPGKPIIDVTWLAKGGILTRPTLIGAGEAGREAVLPLDNNTGWIDELAAKLNAAGGGDEPIILQVMIGGNKILEEVVDAAARKNAKAGRTVVQVGV